MVETYQAKAFLSGSEGVSLSVRVVETPLAQSANSGELRTRKTRNEALEGLAGDYVVISGEVDGAFDVILSGDLLVSASAMSAAAYAMHQATPFDNGKANLRLENGMRVPCLVDGNAAYIAASPAQYEELPSEEFMPLMLALGVSMAETIPNAMPMIVENDLRVLLFPLKDIDKVTVDEAALNDIAARLGVHGVLLLQADGASPRILSMPMAECPSVVPSHMFAVAAGCYLYDIISTPVSTFAFKEGASTISVRMNYDDDTGAWLPFIGGAVQLS